MSWQAIESVQDNSKVDDHTGLNIMYVIARYADANGSVGAGGRATSPSIDTIATKSRCHRNTVLNWLPKLEATGELAIERLGSGRGSWNRYTINLPMPDENNGTSKDVPLSKDMVQEMVQNIGLMVQGAMAEMKVMVHDMVHNGTSHVVLDTKDTDKEKKENNIYIPTLPDSVSSMIAAIAQISGVTYADHLNGKQFEDTAYALIGNDITPDDLQRFGVWWSTNGHYSGKPAIKSILTKVKAAKDAGWVDLPKLSTNGNGRHEKPVTIDPLMPKPGQGGVY